MKHIEGNFFGIRNTKIYYQGWLPEEDVKAVIIVAHGLGEHSGRYLNVVNHLVPQGYAVYALDHIGHGKSDGLREYVEGFDDFTITLNVFYKMVRDWQKGIDLFLLGHSMGGAIASYYLLDHPEDFKGAILSAPTVLVGDSVSPMIVMMGRIFSKLLPKLGVMGVDPSTVSSDPKVVEAYIDDPLVFHGKTTAQLGAELLSAMERITAEAENFNLPLLIVQGSADVLVDPSGAKMLHEKASSKDKTLKFYQGFHHEIFNEPGRDQVLTDVENWLEKQI